MADYLAMTVPQLQDERKKLTDVYQMFADRGLALDMSRGKPSPEQLDLSMGLFEIRQFIGENGVDARNYGNLEGMPEARRFFSGILGVSPDEVLVGGNSSLHMMYSMVELASRRGFPDGSAPWVRPEHKPKFLCPSPGYDRHFFITEYFGYEMLTVPMLPTGPDMDLVEQLAKDPDVKGIWCVPKYSNPDGYSYSDDTVRRLARMETGAPDFRIFWDNAYAVHHISDTPDEVLNIMDLCREAGYENRPLLFCSLSKVTFSGASVAAMAASKANLTYILSNLAAATIGFDKVNQLRHVLFLKDMEGLQAHMCRQRALIEPKFQIVWELFEQELAPCGNIARWTHPNGGYFISLYTMDGCAKRTVELCAKAGVKLTAAGAAFPYGKDPHDSNIRIAPTYPPLEELRTAAQLLCVALRLATVEKLLEKHA